MALINCPECGKEISSLSKHCVHCGCIFKVCEECGAVWCGDQFICMQCGYEIKQVNSPNEKEQADCHTECDSNGNDVNAGKKYDICSGVNKKGLKSSILKKLPINDKIRINICSIISCAALVVALIRILIWRITNPLEALFAFSEVKQFVVFCLIVSGIATFLSYFIDVRLQNALAITSLKLELHKNNSNLREQVLYMLNYYDWEHITEENKTARLDDMSFCLNVHIMESDEYVKRNELIIIPLLKFISEMPVLLYGYYFLFSNVEKIMIFFCDFNFTSFYDNLGISLGEILIVLLVVTVWLIIISLIEISVVKKKTKNVHRKWVEINDPNQIEKFDELFE